MKYAPSSKVYYSHNVFIAHLYVTYRLVYYTPGITEIASYTHGLLQ
jgi:hypothetical protein